MKLESSIIYFSTLKVMVGYLSKDIKPVNVDNTMNWIYVLFSFFFLTMLLPLLDLGPELSLTDKFWLDASVNWDSEPQKPATVP